MPILNWIGKDAVINHHHDVPYRTLDKKYTFANGKCVEAADNVSMSMSLDIVMSTILYITLTSRYTFAPEIKINV